MGKLSVFVFVTSAFLAVGASGHDVEPEPLKVLMVGNSFSISCLTHLPQMAADCSKRLDIASLYIGGCSLERHATNVTNEQNGMEGTYRYDRVVCNGRKTTKQKMRLTDALRSARWDVVTIQQASHLSWKKESYHPWGDILVATVRQLAPQAKIIVQQTWSYTPFAAPLSKWKITQDEMYARLDDAYRDFAGAYGFDVIRMGRAVQEWRKRLPVAYGERSFGGDVVGGRHKRPEGQFKRGADGKWIVDSDTTHLNERGEYLQALVWAVKLLDADIERLSTHPDCVTDAEDRLMRKIAREVAR